MNSELIFRVIFLVLFILVIYIYRYYARKVQRPDERYFSIDKKSIEREGRLSIMLRINLFFFGAAMIIYAIYPPWMTWFTLPFPIWLRWIGVGLGLLSLLLLIWVQRVLGKYWSTELELREEPALITSGPYRARGWDLCTNLPVKSTRSILQRAPIIQPSLSLKIRNK